jgi:uncharacterized protein with HEPN domain
LRNTKPVSQANAGQDQRWSDEGDGRRARRLFAVTRAVEIVGEAASKVSDAGRAEVTAVPWQQIVGMRNRLIHAYFDINRDILWDTVRLALPPLLSQLKAVPLED